MADGVTILGVHVEDVTWQDRKQERLKTGASFVSSDPLSWDFPQEQEYTP